LKSTVETISIEKETRRGWISNCR